MRGDESGLTQQDLMQVFGFTQADLDANRQGRVTARQKLRLFRREGLWVGGCMAVCLVIGIGSAAVWISSLRNPPFSGVREVKFEFDFSFLPEVAIVALVFFFLAAAAGRGLIVDLWRGNVQMHVGRMEVVSGFVRMRYRASGKPSGPVFDMSSEGKFDIDYRGSTYESLHARGAGAFECITYRTTGGLRILSVELNSDNRAYA